MQVLRRWWRVSVGFIVGLGCITGCMVSPPSVSLTPTPSLVRSPTAVTTSVLPSPPTAHTPTMPPSDVGQIEALPAAMEVARAAHTATLLADGQVLVTGGFDGQNAHYHAQAERFNPKTRTFTPVGEMGVARSCHTATLLTDGRVLITGGFNGAYLRSAEVYDPGTSTFTATQDLTTARSCHTAVLLADGKVLLVGGVGEGWTFLASAELYDPVTNTFTATGSMRVPRESHTATLLPTGEVLILGGHSGRRADISIYASAERYTPQTGQFTVVGTMQVPRHKHDAILLQDGRVLITGGADERDAQGVYSSTEIYSLATDTFIAGPTLDAPRYKHQGTSIVLPNAQVLIAGGARQATLYNPSLDAFTRIPGNLGTGRLFATATLLMTGEVLIIGGYGPNTTPGNSGWLYSPSASP